jgi:hypothetical protein
MMAMSTRRFGNVRTTSIEGIVRSRLRGISPATAVLSLVLVVAACSPNDDRGVSSSSQSVDSGAVQLLKPATASRGVAALRECMSARGWDAEVDGTGLEFPPLSDAQEAARLVDMRMCDGTSVESDETQSWERVRSIDVIASFYREYRRLTRCLVENGYPVPDVPSWDTFLDTWVTGAEEDVWSPLARLHEERRAGNTSLIEAALNDCVGEGEEH